ncbi:MAG: dTDP-4-dehydrorhamnose reductase [Clostridia bacterium]|nr:dTDP-4-dehydrorhamnose reductase [Clostridia bacterium]
MKILVTGYNGQLGFDVVKELENRRIPCKGVDMADFDITDEAAVRKYISDYAPDAVIHCAAFTAVDKAEDCREACFKVNAAGTENIAKICGETGAKMVYISTDYVYDGKGEEPFEVTSSTATCNVYGSSKLAGEIAVKKHCVKYFIVRTSWVFGVNGGNFVKTMLRLSETHSELNVVADQIGSPTYTPDLAKLICDMALSNKYGVYHATNEGFCSWYEFACEIFKKAKKDVKVNPVTTAEYCSKAARPLNSRLSKKCLDDAGFERLPEWQNALERFLKELMN